MSCELGFATGFLNTQAIELVAQAVGIESRRLADHPEVLLILKEILFGFALGAESSCNPFPNRCHEHCLPETHLHLAARIAKRCCRGCHGFPRARRVPRVLERGEGNKLAERSSEGSFHGAVCCFSEEQSDCRDAT